MWINGGQNLAEIVCCADLGTTHIKAALVDSAGEIVALSTLDAPPALSHDAGVVFDAQEYLRLTCHCIAEVAARAAKPVAGLALTSQRATVVPLGPSGLPAGPAISWQDGRGERALARFVGAFGAGRFREITGLPPGVLWSLAKILWLREPEGARCLVAPAHRLALLHDWILWRLGAQDLVTDPSNASLSGLLDLSRLAWSSDLLGALDLEARQLPAILPAGTPAGVLGAEMATATGLPVGTRLVVGGGDQQCAALGAGVCDPGRASLCVGTAAVVSSPSDKPVSDAAGRWFCTAHVVSGRWVLEGIHNAFGSSMTWGATLLGLEEPAELEALAAQCPGGTGDVVFLPFLAGIGSPDFDPAARGTLSGLRLGTSRAQVARAVLVGVCLEVRRILDAMEPEVEVGRLLIVGGAAAGHVSQILADMTGRSLGVSAAREASLLGAAILAWTGAGRFADARQGAAEWSDREVAQFDPRADPTEVARTYRRYCTLVEAMRRGPLTS